MASQSWFVNIVPSGNFVSLNPDVSGAKPNAPLQARIGDFVTWNNQTDGPQQVAVMGETLDAAPSESTTIYQIENTDKFPPPYTIEYHVNGKQGMTEGQIIVFQSE
ncbi:MAG: hypothetical protein ACRD3J_20695 [Thermoanaerobaculia bacterium]